MQDDKEDLQVANEPSGEEQEAQVDQLKEDLDQAKAEASLCEEREQLQQLEVGAASVNARLCPRRNIVYLCHLLCRPHSPNARLTPPGLVFLVCRS